MRCNAPYAIGDDLAEHDLNFELLIEIGDWSLFHEILKHMDGYPRQRGAG